MVRGVGVLEWSGGAGVTTLCGVVVVFCRRLEYQVLINRYYNTIIVVDLPRCRRDVILLDEFCPTCSWRWPSQFTYVFRTCTPPSYVFRRPHRPTATLRVPTGDPPKTFSPRVPTRKIAIYVFHLRPAPPRIFECYPSFLGVPNCGATSCTCSSVRVLAHIFPTCSTRCASVLRVPRLLPLLCAPSTLDADRTRRYAMVAHSPATAAKIVAGLVINMLPGLAIDLHPQNCATVRQGVTSAATHRQEQSQH